MWARSDSVSELPGGTYQVFARSDGFTSNRTLERAHAKALAYDEAREFCMAKSMQVFLIEDKGTEMSRPATTNPGENPEFTPVYLRFKCAK